MSIIIDSIEYYLPEKTLENSELSELCPEWDMDKVVEKTGVIKRHVAGEDETAYDLSVKAWDKIFSKIDKVFSFNLIFAVYVKVIIGMGISKIKNNTKIINIGQIKLVNKIRIKPKAKYSNVFIRISFPTLQIW